MTRSALITADSIINLALGVLLVFFPHDLLRLLGVPEAVPAFYPSILGAVLFGIGIALWLERGRTEATTRGLGLHGAIAINLCGGLVLAGWLIFGQLELPARGVIFLWILVLILVGISIAELLVSRVERVRSGSGG